MFNQNIDKFISKYNEGSFMTKAQRRALRRQLKNTIDFQQKAKEKKSLELEAKSVNQQNYIDNLIDQNTSIVVAQGPAGTGKTYLAVKAAIRALKYKQHSKIIMTRPAVGVDNEQHGFLPGSLDKKMEPWTRPLFDVLREYYSQNEINHMLHEHILEISPLAFMRGRTLKNSWIIADEMQNATPGQMKMLLTRIGEGSRIVVTGDVEQTDRGKEQNGLLDLTYKLALHCPRGMAKAFLDKRDVQRHPIITEVLNLYG